MTLATHEFIRRLLSHVLPKGFHRIRHYGLFAKSSCADNVARARQLLAVPVPEAEPADAVATEPPIRSHPCPCCGGRMIIIETFARLPAAQPTIIANRRHQDRYVMTTITGVRRRSADLACRWSATGCD
jgi:Putative transposase